MCAIALCDCPTGEHPDARRAAQAQTLMHDYRRGTAISPDKPRVAELERWRPDTRDSRSVPIRTEPIPTDLSVVTLG
jgi:hypothetical protein